MIEKKDSMSFHRSFDISVAGIYNFGERRRS